MHIAAAGYNFPGIMPPIGSGVLMRPRTSA